jgi:hypothetical protein
MVITTRITKELVGDLSSYISKATLGDISRIGPIFIDRGVGKKIVNDLGEKLTPDELKYVFFYFQEELGLMSNDFFWVAAISMITIIEDSSRKFLLSKLKPNVETDEELERLTLGQIKNRLKIYLPAKSIEKLERVNVLRRILIHNNMLEAKNQLLLEEDMVGSDYLVGGGSILKHESTRSLTRMSADRYAVEIFLLGLEIVQELYPNIKSIDSKNFDSIVEHALNPEKVLIIYGEKPKNLE